MFYARQVFLQGVCVSCHCGPQSTVVQSRVCHCRFWILRGTDVLWIWASNRSFRNSAALFPSPIVKRRSMNLGRSLTCCLYQNTYALVLIVLNVQRRLTVSPSVEMTSSLGWVTLSSPLHSGEEQKM